MRVQRKSSKKKRRLAGALVVSASNVTPTRNRSCPLNSRHAHCAGGRASMRAPHPLLLILYFTDMLPDSIPQAQRVCVLINAVDVDDVFQMKMRACRIAGAADLRDKLSGRDELPDRNVERRAVSVARV